MLAEALGMRVVYYDIETKLALGNALANAFMVQAGLQVSRLPVLSCPGYEPVDP